MIAPAQQQHLGPPAPDGQAQIYTIDAGGGEVMDIEAPAGLTAEQLESHPDIQAAIQARGAPAAAAAPSEAPDQMVGGFADQLNQPGAKLSPEDEAAYGHLLRTGDARAINGFLIARQYAPRQGIQGFVAARDKAIREGRGNQINYGVTYDFPKVAKQPGYVAALDGAHSVIPGGDALLAGIDALDKHIEGNSTQTLSQDYEAARDNLSSLAASNSDNSPVLYHGAQLIAGLAIPTGLEGLAARVEANALAAGATATEARSAVLVALRNQGTKAGAIYGGAHGALDARSPQEALLNAPVEALLGAGTAFGLGEAGRRLDPLLQRASSAVRGAVSSVTTRGAQTRAADLIQNAGTGSTADVLSAIDNAAPTLSGARPTLAEVANDAGIAGFQRGHANTDLATASAIGERHAENALARTGAISGALDGGNPQAVQDFAGAQLSAAETGTAAQRAMREAAIADRIRLENVGATDARQAAETNLTQARSTIGPEADRDATGAAARTRFENGYAAARQKTADAYNHPHLTDNEPVVLRPAELVDHYLGGQLGDAGLSSFRKEAIKATRAALPEKPQSLMQFIRANGGVKSDGMGADDLRHSGLIHNAEPGFINSRGLPLDRQLEAAIEAKFVPPGTTLADFAEEINLEHRGLSRLVRPRDANAAYDYDNAVKNREYWQSELDKHGYDSAKMSNEDWRDFHKAMTGAPDQRRTLQDLETEPTPGKVMGPFQKGLADIRDQYFGDGATSIPPDAQTFFNDVMNADTVGIRTLEGWERRAYDMAARAPDRTTAAFIKMVGRAIGAKASVAGGPARAKALAAARAARLEQGRIFETGDAAKVFARDRFNNPVTGDNTISSKLVRPGAAGGDTIEGLTAAVGPEQAENIVRQEIRRLVDEGNVTTAAQARALAVKYGEAARRFPRVQADLQALQAHSGALDAAKVGEAAAARSGPTAEETASLKERTALHDQILASPLAKVADPSVDPSLFVAQLLRRSDAGRQLRFLHSQVKIDRDAVNGFRRALGDYIVDAGKGPNFTASGDQVPSINKTRAAISNVLARAGDALTSQQKLVLQSVGRELQSANFAATMSKPAGSETALNRSFADLMEMAPALGPATGAAKHLLGKVLKALSNEAEVKRLITQAILDPEFAATLLKRATSAHWVEVKKGLTGLTRIEATAGAQVIQLHPRVSGAFSGASGSIPTSLAAAPPGNSSVDSVGY
ncbi:hypothetical protein [Sphingomonas sp. PWP1-2]|uniref:hypothetical protein n=1 Tax=Sphingomonas sp. PWP1-2 TaxID=2804558 RepID=UPI003CF58DEF